MKNRKNIYVIVCKNDKLGDENEEIVLETYTKFASLANAKKHIENKRFDRLGKCRIAKLEFVTEYEEEIAG